MYYFWKHKRSEPKDISDKEEILIDIDEIITIDEYGSWDYEDKDLTWAKSDDYNGEYWETKSDKYPEMDLIYYKDLVEHIDDLLEPLLPFEKGTYHIQGKAKLVFEVYGIELYSEYQGEGYHREDVVDEEYVLDNAEIEFLDYESSIDNFEIEKL